MHPCQKKKAKQASESDWLSGPTIEPLQLDGNEAVANMIDNVYAKSGFNGRRLAEGAQLQHQHPATGDWIAMLQSQQDALLATGRITRPEALSLVNLQNAVNSLVEAGILSREDDQLADRAEARTAMATIFAPMVS